HHQGQAAILSGASRRSRGVLVTPLLSEPEFDRTVVGPPQTHGVGQCLVYEHSGPRGRLPQGRTAGDRQPRAHEVYVYARGACTDLAPARAEISSLSISAGLLS